ncbi:hypothetical protein Btru_031152 [Bulinus truncatus]|nr:hypothetical protein Btru_031152 [Bulinus truncatus]
MYKQSPCRICGDILGIPGSDSADWSTTLLTSPAITVVAFRGLTFDVGKVLTVLMIELFMCPSDIKRQDDATMDTHDKWWLSLYSCFTATNGG